VERAAQVDLMFYVDLIFAGRCVLEEEPCAEEYEDTRIQVMSARELILAAQQLLYSHTNHVHISMKEVRDEPWHDVADKIASLFKEAKRTLEPAVKIHEKIVEIDAIQYGNFTVPPLKGIPMPTRTFNSGPQSNPFAKRGTKGGKKKK